MDKTIKEVLREAAHGTSEKRIRILQGERNGRRWIDNTTIDPTDRYAIHFMRDGHIIAAMEILVLPHINKMMLDTLFVRQLNEKLNYWYDVVNDLEMGIRTQLKYGMTIRWWKVRKDDDTFAEVDHVGFSQLAQ